MNHFYWHILLMHKLIFTAALLALASSAMARDEQKVFKWEDEEGNVYYGDSVPQRFAERPKEVLNEHGVTVAELEGRKTEEQLAQEQIDKERRERQEQQMMADRALLSTYLSVEEIRMHRDRRVELFQAQSRVTELYLRNLDRRLQELRNEASRYQPYSEDPNAPMIAEDLAKSCVRQKTPSRATSVTWRSTKLMRRTSSIASTATSCASKT